MTIWFDVEDLVHYFQVGNKRISGIQRLSFEIFRGAKALSRPEDGHDIRFVRHGSRPLSLIEVSWDALVADFGEGAEPAPAAAQERSAEPSAVPVPGDSPPAPKSLPRRLARRAFDILPPHVRKPLVLASVMQLQVLGALAAFGAQAAALPVRRAYAASRTMATQAQWRIRKGAATATPGLPFERLAKPGDTLLVLGAPWDRERYSDIARWVRDEKRMRFGVLMHDLVPIRHPEWCHRGVPRAFREWYLDVLPFCDVVFANSRHTAADVEAFARESGIVLNGPVRPLPIGTGFGEASGAAIRSARLPPAGSYVLFVSTLEARKNHALAVQVWRVLLEEAASGKRDPATIPDLVFAGRVGWLVSDLLWQLNGSDWLGGRVKFVRDPSDAELRALYAGCLFTFFPSLHEGWGLPVTESLSQGKPCLTSNAASLPEAGGALCRYFDPESLREAQVAVSALLDDPPSLAAWERQVRTEFKPVPWTQTATALLNQISPPTSSSSPPWGGPG